MKSSNIYIFITIFLLLSPIFYQACKQSSGTLKGFVYKGMQNEPLSSGYLTLITNDGDFNLENIQITNTGCFLIEDLPEGSYDLLSTAQGFAGSRIQSIIVTGDTITEVEVRHFPLLDDNLSLHPPTINVKGISSGEQVCDLVNLSITISSSNYIFSTFYNNAISLYYGSIYTQPAISTNRDYLVFGWDTSIYAPGENFLHIVAFDINNNRTQLTVPITICQLAGNPPTSIPASLSLTTVTLGEAPIDYSKVMIRLSWEEPDNVLGHRVLRREIDSMGNVISDYQLIGNIPTVSITGQNNYYEDLDPSLKANHTYQYKLESYNRAGWSNSVQSDAITPLNSYALSLSSPETNSKCTPTVDIQLNWTVDPKIESAVRYDYLYVWNEIEGTNLQGENPVYLTGTSSNELILIGSNSYSVSATSLIEGYIYRWDIYKSYYLASDGTNSRYSYPRAFPQYGIPGNYGSSNGCFYFEINLP